MDRFLARVGPKIVQNNEDSIGPIHRTEPAVAVDSVGLYGPRFVTRAAVAAADPIRF